MRQKASPPNRRGLCVRIVLTLVGMCMLAGCGKKGPRTYPVTGIVKFADGVPVAGGIIEFSCSDPKSTATGRIDSEGRFRLSTNRDGDGAVAGQHSVVVIQGTMPIGISSLDAAEGHSHVVRKLHAKHAQHETTNITKTVSTSTENELIIVVESATP